MSFLSFESFILVIVEAPLFQWTIYLEFSSNALRSINNVSGGIALVQDKFYRKKISNFCLDLGSCFPFTSNNYPWLILMEIVLPYS